MRRFYPAGVTAMCVLVPVLLLLGIVYLFYQTEFSVQATALAAGIAALVLLGRSASATVKVCAVMALLGIAVLTLEDIVRVLGIVFGLVLIGTGGISIVRAWMFARRAELKNWWLLALLSGIMIVFGLLLLINPWWKEITQLFDVIGYMLLYSAVVSIVRLIFLWPIKGE
jgi:uncharacterized membrane protein HdeD (DUF308 family)